MSGFFGWHIGWEYIYFKSRRKEWSITVWRNVKYHRPPPRAKFIPSFVGETRNMVSGMGAIKGEEKLPPFNLQAITDKVNNDLIAIIEEKPNGES